jgi:hypothetical protein
MKKSFVVPAWHSILLLCLTLMFGSSCNLLDPDPDDGIAYCTSDVLKSKDFVITQNQLNLNTYSFDGDYIIYEYSNYQNQICPSKTTTVSCNIQLASEQPKPVGVSLWIEWGPDPLQRIEKNYMQGILNQDMTILVHEVSAGFIPGEWVTMDDAAIVTTKIRFRFASPYHDPNSDIVYLSSLFKSFRVTTNYYPY